MKIRRLKWTSWQIFLSFFLLRNASNRKLKCWCGCVLKCYLIVKFSDRIKTKIKESNHNQVSKIIFVNWISVQTGSEKNIFSIFFCREKKKFREKNQKKKQKNKWAKQEKKKNWCNLNLVELTGYAELWRAVALFGQTGTRSKALVLFLFLTSWWGVKGGGGGRIGST